MLYYFTDFEGFQGFKALPTLLRLESLGLSGFRAFRSSGLLQSEPSPVPQQPRNEPGVLIQIGLGFRV